MHMMLMMMMMMHMTHMMHMMMMLTYQRDTCREGEKLLSPAQTPLFCFLLLLQLLALTNLACFRVLSKTSIRKEMPGLGQWDGDFFLSFSSNQFRRQETTSQSEFLVIPRLDPKGCDLMFQTT